MKRIIGGTLGGSVGSGVAAASGNALIGPFPRGSRLRRVIVHASARGAAAVAAGHADLGVALWPLTSPSEFVPALALASVGSTQSHRSGWGLKAEDGGAVFTSMGFQVAPLVCGVAVEIPMDVVFGEMNVGALQLCIGSLTADICAAITWTVTVDVELPRLVNAESLASPPAPVAKDEPT